MIPPLYLRFIPSACAGVPTCATAPGARRASRPPYPVAHGRAWLGRVELRRVRRQSRTGAFAARIGARGYTTLTNVGENPCKSACERLAWRVVTRLSQDWRPKPPWNGHLWTQRDRRLMAERPRGLAPRCGRKVRRHGGMERWQNLPSSSRPMRIRARDPSVFARAAPARRTLLRAMDISRCCAKYPPAKHEPRQTEATDGCLMRRMTAAQGVSWTDNSDTDRTPTLIGCPCHVSCQ
jgi:hypothetical protein